MQLCELLGVSRGVTAIIGSGGKTTAMYTLADELRRRGTVICCTTTRIFPPDHIPVYTGSDMDALVSLLLESGCVCAGTVAENGKLKESAIAMETLAAIADFVLVEADGSKGLPLKAHLGHEPVIPECAKTTILLVGAEGFGKPAADAAHRPERFCALAEIAPSDAVTPAAAAAVINREALAAKLLINQVESEETMANARSLAELVNIPVFAGAIRRGEWVCLL